jgi:hypothetical protein
VNGDDIVEATSEPLGVIMDLQEELQQVRLNHITTIGELQTAADEIERLRAEVERKHDYACRMDALAEARLMEITRLRAAGDALAVAYRTLGGLDVAHDAALLAWEEARRER